MATKKQYKVLSDQQMDKFMKRFWDEHPGGRWQPHYYNYIAHNTQTADGHRQEISQYQFTFLDKGVSYLLSVGMQNIPDLGTPGFSGYHNQTNATFEQVYPKNQGHRIFEYDDIPPLADIANEKDPAEQEALYLTYAMLKEIDKKCITK